MFPFSIYSRLIFLLAYHDIKTKNETKLKGNIAELGIFYAKTKEVKKWRPV